MLEIHMKKMKNRNEKNKKKLWTFHATLRSQNLLQFFKPLQALASNWVEGEHSM
jgi:hypothetical protein